MSDIISELESRLQQIEATLIGKQSSVSRLDITELRQELISEIKRVREEIPTIRGIVTKADIQHLASKSSVLDTMQASVEPIIDELLRTESNLRQEIKAGVTAAGRDLEATRNIAALSAKMAADRLIATAFSYASGAEQ